MAQSLFGVGFMFATPGAANPTVNRFGRLQDVSVDFSFDLKLLYGSNQFALEQARGKGKIDIKASIGVIDPTLFNTIFFGLTTTTGETLSSIDESATTATTTFTVANAATYSADLGLYNTVTGLWMTRVASAPGAGAYSVNLGTGVYTIAAAQENQLLKVSYTYLSAATGKSLAFPNQIMGNEPAGFQLQLVNKFKGSDGLTRSMYLNFANVVCPKLSMPLKLDDFTLPGLEMSAQDDGTGNVFNYSMTG